MLNRLLDVSQSKQGQYAMQLQHATQLLSTKTNFIHLIHQADLQINSKTIESTQSFMNIAKHFQMLSEMSIKDLATIGNTLGFGETIDNPRSARWCGATAAQGVGFTNNDIIGFQHTGATLQNQINCGVANTGIQSRLNRFTEITNNYNGIAPTILSATNLQNECKPTYQVLNGLCFAARRSPLRGKAGEPV